MCTRGTTLDGTNLLVDRRSWLEVDDAKHRYGKHLRLYYDEWKAAGRPEGWTAHVSARNGSVFFWHRESNHRQIEVPPGFADAAPTGTSATLSANAGWPAPKPIVVADAGAADDPGTQAVARMYRYYKKHGHEGTICMPASWRPSRSPWPASPARQGRRQQPLPNRAPAYR